MLKSPLRMTGMLREDSSLRSFFASSFLTSWCLVLLWLGMYTLHTRSTAPAHFTSTHRV